MPIKDESDDRLVALAGGGDRSAAGELILRHSDKILSVCWRMLGDRAAAEDVSQETFLRLWRFAPKWDPQGGARIDTWLYRVAMNGCLDRLRMRRREAPEDEAPDLVDEGPSATQKLIAQERRKSVEDALESLPARQRMAVILCHFQEMSNLDAAAAMDVSVDALESLLSRGRRALKSLLLPMRDELMEGMV